MPDLPTPSQPQNIVQNASAKLDRLAAELNAIFPDYSLLHAYNELTLTVPAEALCATANTLRDNPALMFAQLIDICVVDYSHYGQDEWLTQDATGEGFSRGVATASSGRLQFGEDDPAKVKLPHPRFAAIYHLLSYQHNWRLRLKVFAPDDAMPVIPSVIEVWPAADWYEREAFDLFGVLFAGHTDLRRILTDYGFIGHPFRKDFPLIGHVGVRYDPEQQRVLYEPVDIEPRVLVPRVIRNNTAQDATTDTASETDTRAGDS